MKIYAIGDLHLSFGIKNKSMEIFGDAWKDHEERVKAHWINLIKPEDLILIPGDISWAMKLEEALVDLAWIDELPGTKVLIRGNHDYWWPSLKKLHSLSFKSLHFIHNNALTFGDVTIGGTRLWDSDEYHFYKVADVKHHYEKELIRLEDSLKQVDKQAPIKLAMTHYPPIGADLSPSKASTLFEKYGVQQVVFGHLHGIPEGSLPFGEARGVHYHLTSCDVLKCTPFLLKEL
ncbi:metallophosphoesterase [Chlamydiales bacterium]|nr:metallophosphoesterase [Chlamydiales bacterium]